VEEGEFLLHQIEVRRGSCFELELGLARFFKAAQHSGSFFLAGIRLSARLSFIAGRGQFDCLAGLHLCRHDAGHGTPFLCRMKGGSLGSGCG